MPSKLIVFPLVFLFCCSVFSLFLSGEAWSSTGKLSVDSGVDILYDANTHPTCFLNGTGCDGELGYLESISQWDPQITDLTHVSVSYFWDNNTLYDANGTPVYLNRWQVFPDENAGAWMRAFTVTTGLGWLAVLGVVMILGCLVGVRFLSSGFSEVSVATLVKGALWVGLFLAVLAPCYPYILMIPVFGWLIFFGLTALYTFGVAGEMGNLMGGGSG